MSLATGLVRAIRRSGHGHGHASQPAAWTTSEFCDWLEKAVDYMQTSPPSEELEQLLLGQQGKSFVRLVWRAVHAGRYYMLACVIMLFYDYAVTVDLEVKWIWKTRRKGMITYLFFVNRYLPLITYLFVIFGVFSTSSSHNFCVNVFGHFPPVMIVLSEFAIGLLRISKIRALWREELNRALYWAVVGVFVLQTALAISCAVAVQGVGPLFGKKDQIGCFIIFHSGSMPRIILHWFCNLVFNVLVFYCILTKALSVRGLGGARNIADVLLRDAITFLVVLSVVKIGNLIMLIIFPYWNAINWSFNHMADVILTSHLIFNLRAAIRPPSEEYDDDKRLISTNKGPSTLSDNKEHVDDIEAIHDTDLRRLSVVYYLGPEEANLSRATSLHKSPVDQVQPEV